MYITTTCDDTCNIPKHFVFMGGVFYCIVIITTSFIQEQNTPNGGEICPKYMMLFSLVILDLFGKTNTYTIVAM